MLQQANYTGLYYDGIFDGPVQCDLTLSDQNIHIYTHEPKKELLIWKLKKVASCKYDGYRLKITKGQGPVQSLECTGEIAKKIYEAWNESPSHQPVKNSLGNSTFIFFIVSGIVLLLAGLAVYFYVLPWASQKAAALIPMEYEVKIGQSLSEVYLKENKTNEAANKLANDFLSKIKTGSDYPIRLTILKSNEINAFALPGGNIFIYSGLLKKMESGEELVALLGHEITHVTERHALKSLLRKAATGLVVATLFGDIEGISAWLISKADEFKQLGYSRDLETEADNEGLAMMVRNNLDPKGMLRLLRILKKESMEEPVLMKYLSTHPDTDSRIENVASQPEINKTYPVHEDLGELFKKLKSVDFID